MDKRLNFIVLDKDQTEVELIELQLRKAGLRYSIKRVGNVDLLFEIARDFPPDIVFANQALPRFDVGTALPLAKQKLIAAPWIIYALTGNEETAVQCMKAGASDFVLKKHFSRLGASVKQILEARVAAEVPAPEPKPTRSHEQKAEKSETDLFRQIVEHSPDLIAVLNLEGRREYNNPLYNDILEDPDILVGTDSFLDILPEDRERIRAMFQGVIQRGKGERTEYRLMDKNGDTRFIQSSSGIIADEAGKPQRVVVISRDVTDRTLEIQRFENLIAATADASGEKFFQMLVPHVSEALGVRVALVSQVIDESRTRIKSLAFWKDGSLQPSLEYDVQETPCERVVRGGQMIALRRGAESRFPKMNSVTSMHLESYLGVPINSSEGTVIGHLFIADDKPMVDESRKEFVLQVMARRASLELQRSMAPTAPRSAEKEGEVDLGDACSRMRTAIDGLPFPVVMTDENGTITLANGKLAELSGRGPDDLLNRRAWPLILMGGPWKLLKEEYPDRVERPDRTAVPVNVFAIPCRNMEGRISGTLGILTQCGEAQPLDPQ